MATKIKAEIRYYAGWTYGQYYPLNATRARVERRGNDVIINFDGEPGPGALSNARLAIPAGTAIAVARLLACVAEGHVPSAEGQL